MGFSAAGSGHELVGIDNFIRPGSEVNRTRLAKAGVKLHHGDLRSASDLEALPACDWIYRRSSQSQCPRRNRWPLKLSPAGRTQSPRDDQSPGIWQTAPAGFILLSTSRVYSIAPLAALKVQATEGAFHPVSGLPLPDGLTEAGINEAFPTSAPISLYGATKLASETLALEYGETFNLPIFINRCGVLAGAGQFGRPDQGVFTYWINSHFGVAR